MPKAASGFGLRRILITGSLPVIALATALPAKAHPHVLVTARVEIVFGDGSLVTAIRHIWQFDPAFSAYAMQGYDANNDGVITRAELAPLAEINVESLAAYGFFTWLHTDRGDAEFLPPTEYWDDVYDGRLTLFYTLPLAEPVPVDDVVSLEVYDPEYYVAFSFDEVRPATVVNAPDGCQAAYHPPEEIDAATAARLAAIPADQRELPPELAMLTSDYANAVRITCQ